MTGKLAIKNNLPFLGEFKRGCVCYKLCYNLQLFPFKVSTFFTVSKQVPCIGVHFSSDLVVSDIHNTAGCVPGAPERTGPGVRPCVVVAGYSQSANHAQASES
jgi:hypothetical protein